MFLAEGLLPECIYKGIRSGSSSLFFLGHGSFDLDKIAVSMYKIPLDLIRMDPGGCHLMLHATINDWKANVLIDTGASKSVMDVSQAKKYLDQPKIKAFENHFTGMGAARIETWYTIIPSLAIGHTTIHDMQILLIDMHDIRQSYARHDLPRIDMVMGGDLLLNLGAIVDYSKRMLVITA